MSPSAYDEALTAICAVLTTTERAAIVASAGPRYRGAEAADILDLAWEHDSHLDIREPFMETNPDLAGRAAASVALLAVIRLGQTPTRDRVIVLMHRAGMAPRLGPADISALAGEVTGLARRTRATAAVADDLDAAELSTALADLADAMDEHAQVLVELAAATEGD